MKKTDWLAIFSGPVLCLITILFGPSEILKPEIWKVLGVAVWMITWWVTEAVPLPVTALLPILLLPLLGIFKVSEATAPYASSVIFLFMGGFMIALGMEKHKLHLRIALNLLRVTGTSGNGIILGFMLATASLSMWISNTATAVMMLPVASSVVSVLETNGGMKTSHIKFAPGLMLSIAYAANIGGLMTLIGTPPNIVMVGYLRQMAGYEMAFGKWLLIGIPIGILLLAACYILITRFLFRNNLREVPGSGSLIRQNLEELGKVSKAEKWVMLVFVLTALGWILKNLINELTGSTLSDTTIAMAGGLMMFMIPGGSTNSDKKSFLLKWEDTAKLPWGILILFGGGLCLAQALEKTGVIQLIGDAVGAYSGMNFLLITIVTIAVVIFVTELMSNTALAVIFIPVVIGVADGMGINPLLLAIPATLAASCAFMMPVSTPPNAIVFASGKIKMREMIKAGIWLNLVSIGIIALVANWLVRWIFI